MANETTVENDIAKSSRFVIRIDGSEDAMKAAGEKAGALLKGLARAGRRVRTLVIRDIQGSFNTPGMLRSRSGWLANSITGRVRRRPSAVRVEIGVRKGIPYGVVFEVGKITKPHVIRPIRKRALRWASDASGGPGVLSRGRPAAPPSRGGRQGTAGEAFARSVRHPGSKFVPRPFLKPGVLRNRDAIAALFHEEVQKALVAPPGA